MFKSEYMDRIQRPRQKRKAYQREKYYDNISSINIRQKKKNLFIIIVIAIIFIIFPGPWYILYARAHPYAHVTRNNTNFAIVLKAL